MAFIGNTVQTQGFTPAVDYFSGNGSTVTFTLTRPVAAAVQVEAVIDNVVQNPSTAYTVSGNAITFTSAPLSGTNNIYVRYTSLITTYNAISQSPSVIGDITASGGYLSTGSFNNSFLDGTIVDYVTGNGRITVGSADGFTIYTGGTSARSALASWTQTGALTLPVDASISGLTVGKGGGSQSTSTSVGASAGTATQTIGYNTSIGYQANQVTTTGYSNTGVGALALAANISGASNTVVGASSGQLNTGNSNSVLGAYAFQANTSGGSNVAIGTNALNANTTASNNTAVGYQAGYSNTTGAYNTFVGQAAGYTQSGSAALANTFIGYQAGQVVTTGQINTFVGFAAGNTITTGSKNTILGGYNGNQGGLDIRTASNYIVLSDGDGNPLAYVQNGGSWFQKSNSATWAITSDARIKKNVISLESGLNVISALRPVEFDYIKDDKHDIGFIAQEYQTVLPAQISNGEDGMLSLNQNLVPYLVKAIQELKAEVDALKAGK